MAAEQLVRGFAHDRLGPAALSARSAAAFAVMLSAAVLAGPATAGQSHPVGGHHETENNDYAANADRVQPAGYLFVTPPGDRDWFFYDYAPLGRGHLTVRHVSGNCSGARLRWAEPGPPGPNNGGQANGPEIPRDIGGVVDEKAGGGWSVGSKDYKGDVVSALPLGDVDLFYAGFIANEAPDGQSACVVRLTISRKALVNRRLPSDAKYLADKDVSSNQQGDDPTPIN